ncbi:MAG: hypothetical protein H6662_16285 [Ardenticatenaceae bacterium]|nr:hypothetical protein [Anaerolineales bacterium]MCB8923146.1 hypothetical protein [Ardenticatenaceae bacterium]MCB9005205.1 hypothetical protein [Ardenticatenaceae bacterium]
MIDHHVNFPSQYVQPRQVDVWLPPGYEWDTAVSYPVLYMHDGQNLFDPATAYGGVPWRIGETANRLIYAGKIRPVIVVGIWNGGELRWPEYLPQRPFATPVGPQYLARVKARYAQRFNSELPSDPLSDNYLRFLVEEVKPFIDTHYRTQPQRESTSIMGSSMGGLISLYALCEYPHVFAAAGCVSTHWPAVEGVIQPYLRQYLPAPGTHKLYFDYGTETLDAQYEPHQQKVDALLREQGHIPGPFWQTYRFDGAAHNEVSWQARVHIPLTFLLGKQ